MSSTESSPSSHWAKDNAEEDRVEQLIRSSGCWDEHINVVNCMDANRDWRKCQQEVVSFRECMKNSQKDRNK